MKIKELENLLSISRSNIRFYEKQGLFVPERKENNYREYTEQDVYVLKKIIVLRKMGFSIEEIKLIQNNELPFHEALTDVQHRMEEEINQLQGSLKLIKKVARENSSFDEIDIDKQWKVIQESEKSGERFVDACKDFMELELRSFDFMWKYAFFHDFKKSRAKHGILGASAILLLICILRGIVNALKGEVSFWFDFWSGFLYPFAIALAGTVVILPLYILGKKFPKAASIIATILLIFIFLFFAGILLLFLYGIIKLIV